MRTIINFLSYIAQFFSELEIFQTKVVEKIKTNVSCSGTCVFFPENHVFYEVKWKNIVQPERQRMKIMRVRFAEHLGLQTHTENM